MVIQRTCTEAVLRGSSGHRGDSKPLSAYRHLHAYVLLGEPGSGKTTAFQAEVQHLRSQAVLLTAREFLAGELNADEVSCRTLFIDGMDEIRGGTGDLIAPLDRIRRRLLRLGSPRFRLSYRRAGWLGSVGRECLELVAQDSTLAVLCLEPLEEHDVLTLLSGRDGVDEPTEFIRAAEQKGMGGLLGNPLAVKLLAWAVNRRGAWPESRTETFGSACSEMVLERNRGHRAGSRGRIPSEVLLDLAGRLCAIQLISDLTGFALDEDAEDSRYPFVDSCTIGSASGLREALATKLFKADSTRRFSPVHRQVAEYLAAKHIARRVALGLPVRRVLALMTGSDGTVVTGLRGLAAWLATFSDRARLDIVRLDPVAAAACGDLQAFLPTDKRRILASLFRQPERLSRAALEARAFSQLVTEKTQSAICEVLVNSKRGSIQEARVGFVLRTLGYGEFPADLAQVVFSTARDDTWSPEIRQTALEAYIRLRQGHPALARDLEELLAEVEAIGVNELNADFCGLLLGHLYPDIVGPRRIWDYLTPCSGWASLGHYRLFWISEIPRTTADAQLPVLLDDLASRIPNLDAALEVSDLRWLFLDLLAKGLCSHGDSQLPKRTYTWLGIGVAAHARASSGGGGAGKRVRTWLEQHPDVQKNVFRFGYELRSSDVGVRESDCRIRMRLLGAKLPTDFGIWCLRQALDLAGKRWEVARHLFLQAYGAIGSPSTGKGLSLKVLERTARRDERLASLLVDLRSPPLPSQRRHEANRVPAKPPTGRERDRQAWSAAVRPHLGALHANRGPSSLLHEFAMIYFGAFPATGGGLTGEAALAHALMDPSLANAAIKGLRSSIDRDDLPTVAQVVRIVRSKKMHALGMPLLVALQEAETLSPDSRVDIDDTKLRTAVACYHCWAPNVLMSNAFKPDWYRVLLSSRPEVVTEVAVQCATAVLGAGQPISNKFWGIAEGTDLHLDMACEAVLQVLRRFPAKCSIQQLDALDRLLWAAIRGCMSGKLLGLARGKLQNSSMNIGQRIRWVGLGLICNQTDHSQAAVALVEGNERRARHLARFLVGCSRSVPRGDPWLCRFADLETLTLELVIRLLGRFFAPSEQTGPGWVRSEIRVPRLLSYLIDRIAMRHDDDAGTALERLLAAESLTRWHDRLDRAREAQRLVQWDSGHCHPTSVHACETLRGGQPANAADLTALTEASLQRIASRVRKSKGNDWRQFWNEGGSGKEIRPKMEAGCRDVLVASLRAELPASVYVRPESQHAAQARAGIEVSGEGFLVPIEVRKNCDRQLWSALSDQLAGKHTIDPATAGFGIHAILWFGREKQMRRPDGERPDSADDLRNLLTDSLNEVEARKISVCVIDVTRPCESQAS